MKKADIISSKQNDAVKFVCKLRDHGKRERYRMFLIEGCREISRAIENDVTIHTIFFCREMMRDNGHIGIIEKSANNGIMTCEVTKNVFEKMSNRENGDGLLCTANFWDTGIEQIKNQNLSFVLVAERIEKSGNLGALMRSAESAGVDAIILCEPVTDIFNPNVVRASQGAMFGLNIVTTDNETAYSLLKDNNIKIFATTPSATTNYFDEDFTGKCAIIVGSEHSGLSDFWMKNDDIKKIALPQVGISDSLNVNDAAVVVLYEALRQRLISQR